MATYTTIARPYARAAFEYAVENKQIAAWSNFFHVAALIISDVGVARLINNPRLSYAEKQKFILDLFNNEISTEQKNFIATVAQFHRFNILPEIAELFDELHKERDKSIEVEVLTAYPIDEQQLKRLQQAIAIRLQREVILKIQIDKSLIGGAVVRAGDFVIDGSSRGQLKRLEQALIE